MDRKIEKFLFLLKPIGLCTVGLVVIYCLFDVIFVVKLKVLGTGYPEAAVLILLLGTFVFLFMVPVLKIYKVEQLQSGIMGVIASVLILMTIIEVQVSLKKAIGEIATASTPSEIFDLPQNEYYAIEDWDVDKKNYGNVCEIISVGREPTSIYSLKSYFAFPFVSADDSSRTVWMCTAYSEMFSHSGDTEIKDAARPSAVKNEDRFLKDLWKDKVFDKAAYFERIYKNDDLFYRYSQILEDKNVKGDFILLSPQYGEYDSLASEDIWSAVKWFVISNIVIFTAFMCVPFNKRKYIEMKRDNKGLFHRAMKLYLQPYKELFGPGSNSYKRKQ